MPAVQMDISAIFDTADQLMTAACEGDCDTVESLLYGEPEMGEAPEAGTVQAMLWNAWHDSAEYKLENFRTSGTAKLVDVTVSCLDITAVADALQTSAPELLTRKAAEIHEVNKVYDAQHHYREDFLREVLLEAAAEVLDEDPPAMERELTLSLVSEDGAWRVEPTEELIRFLSCYVSK